MYAVHDERGKTPMMFGHGDLEISIEVIEGFGKKPGLWITEKDENGVSVMKKVASFCSERTAERFAEYFKAFLILDTSKGG